MKKVSNHFHKFRRNKKIEMQNNFMFIDTETYTKKLNDNQEVLKFKLGCSVYWDRKENIIERKDFFKVNNFWNYLVSKFKETNEIILFAHNMDFDFKILNGYKQLIERGFQVNNWYIQGKTFIINFVFKTEKFKKVLKVWDTMNYSSAPLKKIGKVIGLDKLKIDFEKDTDDKLLIYCRRDTEIIFRFIRELINFLLEYKLSDLKPTSASLSLNIFRHKFYDKQKLGIYIHNWKKAIQLERDSYSGGITDCFKVGEFNEELYKLDINSMYPYVMKNNLLPTKLIFWGSNPEYSSEKLYNVFKNTYKKYALIIRCKIDLPKEFAYILQKSKINNVDKSVFIAGKFDTVLTSPEIHFVMKYGKILEIYEISVYKQNIIFKEFIDFFYDKRLEFKSLKNGVYEQFCKLVMNSQYGKWGQKNIKYFVLKEMESVEIKNFGTIIDADTEEHFQLIQFGNKLFKIEQSDENSKDAFVAISSFVTSYARMLLVKYILKAKRENLYYTDTDSLFVNKIGFDNLKEFISETELGMLKLEEKAKCVKIFRPKFYEFGETFKCKGIKKDSVKLHETDNFIAFEQLRWERFKTSLKNQNIDKQIITKFLKIVNKNYDKGIINDKGSVEPFIVN